MTFPVSGGLKDGPGGAFLAPDDLTRPYFLTDYEMGGIALQDPSEGLLYQQWMCFKAANGDITLQPLTVGGPTIFGNYPEARELSFSFDQNMNAVVAWMAGDVLYYRWYDPDISGYTVSEFSGRGPFVTLDDKRDLATQLALNDIMVYYFRGNELFYRLQRDRYDTEYLALTFAGPRVWIRRCGMGRNTRLQLEFLGSDAQLA